MWRPLDDIDKAILLYLAEHQGTWNMRWDVHERSCPQVSEADFKRRMKTILAMELSGGCECGCRGDFDISDQGLNAIGRARTAEYTGY